MKLLLIAVAGILAKSLLAYPEDPITALIRDQTNLASNAGQNGDQATVDRLTDPQVLFSAGDGTVQRDETLDAGDAVSAELKANTESFHQGGEETRHLCADPSAIFIDQTGASSRAGDLAGGPAVVSNWVLHHADNVAVSSFTLQAGGAEFLAVEIWHRGSSGWLIAGGQSIPLYRDPATMAVPRETLDAYTGMFSAGPGSVVAISLTGKSLTANSGGGGPSPMVPESHDLFFTPGLPRGYLRPHYAFTRDAKGHVSGYLRNGIIFRRVDPATAGTAAPTPRLGPLKLRDFAVHHTDDLAVAAFYHDRDTPYFGQTLHQRYRSMEAWIKRGDTWKMISSQGRQM